MLSAPDTRPTWPRRALWSIAAALVGAAAATVEVAGAAEAAGTAPPHPPVDSVRPPGGAGSAGSSAVNLIIPAEAAWTATGIEVPLGSALHVEATGTARMAGRRLTDWFAGHLERWTVGPEGTYVWPRHYQPHGPFPLPAMAEGPFPAFCLIGKIGEEGKPWYVGRRFHGVARAAGRLWLGVNDDHPQDNHGRFDVTVELAAHPAPPPMERPVIEPGSRSGRPLPGARVLLLYVDGLRPDVLRQMAQDGFLPNLQRVVLDQGVEIANAFTVFPSNTLIANGSLFTGLFSDRTGLKSQNQFERSTLKPKGQLSRWLPDGFIPQPTTRVLNLLDKYAPEHTDAFLRKHRVPTLASRLGKAYRFTTLPIAPLNPPPNWIHRAVNTLGPLGLSVRLPQQLDEVNAAYAVEDVLGDPDARVVTVWFPMVDKTSHHTPRGQFGAARRDLALVDRWVGHILKRLRQVGWDRSTYLMLVSDHGHVGGETAVNQVANLARDWAHRELGCNVRVVGQDWRHPGLDPERFVFLDNQGAGQAKIFLPYGDYLSGPWRRNRLVELTHYAIRPMTTVNLVESLLAFRPPGWDGRGARPIDLMLVKLDAGRVLILRDAQRQAILHHDPDRAGEPLYRYEPVQQLTQSSDGTLHDEPAAPGQDPLGYLQDPMFVVDAGGGSPQAAQEWLAIPHTAREWLLATSQTQYPDAVVAMAKFFAWRSPVADLAEVRDPDLVVTASPGWSFRSDDGQGTDHGSPLADAMRMTWWIAGPNIPRGVLDAPQRMVHVLPTILDLLGWPYDPAQLDGEAIRGIYD
jgi:arylsulfatase A-like enzyme